MTALLFAAAGPGQSGKKTALDKATLEAYVRHLFVMDSRDHGPGGRPQALHLAARLPGCDGARLDGQSVAGYRASGLEGRLEDSAGNVYDVAKNPFKPDLDKLKTEFAPSLGTAGAPVVLVEFSDFQCPYCKQEATMLQENLLSAYPKQVQLYFKEFPLESIHPWAKAGGHGGPLRVPAEANDLLGLSRLGFRPPGRDYRGKLQG